MKLSHSIEKLKDYYERFRKGKVGKIKLKHVDSVLAKLRSKRASLKIELKEAKKQEKRKRLTSKLSVLKLQIDRGEWLRSQIEKNKKGH
ncbi:MAG: hypothetical protein ACR2PG_00505 [Hyphomicrobiaceae bacterium]